MKIALPTRGNMVDDHFGHCEAFTIYTIENNQIVNSELLPSPAGCGCKSGVAVTLAQMGVELMLAGNMGRDEAQEQFCLHREPLQIQQGFSSKE